MGGLPGHLPPAAGLYLPAHGLSRARLPVPPRGALSYTIPRRKKPSRPITSASATWNATAGSSSTRAPQLRRAAGFGGYSPQAGSQARHPAHPAAGTPPSAWWDATPSWPCSTTPGTTRTRTSSSSGARAARVRPRWWRLDGGAGPQGLARSGARAGLVLLQPGYPRPGQRHGGGLHPRRARTPRRSRPEPGRPRGPRGRLARLIGASAACWCSTASSRCNTRPAPCTARSRTPAWPRCCGGLSPAMPACAW